jgi:hypothetical protein
MSVQPVDRGVKGSGLVVPTVGWTWFDSRLQLVMAALLPLAVLFGVFLSGPRYPVEFWPRLIVSISLVVAADIFFEAYLSVRSVEISPAGVTFHFLLHRVETRWSTIKPVDEPPVHGLWGFAYTRPGSARSPTRVFMVTLRQAGAILDYSNAPEWPIRPEFYDNLPR